MNRLLIIDYSYKTNSYLISDYNGDEPILYEYEYNYDSILEYISDFIKDNKPVIICTNVITLNVFYLYDNQSIIAVNENLPLLADLIEYIRSCNSKKELQLYVQFKY